MTLHVTGHFDAGDIDKFDTNVVGRNNTVYHTKRRFMSPEVNMHLKETFRAVGESSGSKEIDDMRFRTTNRMEHNNEKVRFGGSNANPPTVFEEMAK